MKADPAVIEEVEGQWRLKLVIDYGSKPDIQFVPMLFVFEPVVLYERTLTDEGGEKPIINKRQLQNQRPINESTDVGFSNGTGEFFKVTKFNLNIRRDRGFEAGEYMLTLKRSEDGQQIGQKFRVTLKGDNPIVDRRAVSFVGDSTKKKDKPKADPAPAASETPAPSDTASADAKSDSTDSTGSVSAEPPPATPPKQGGCGCDVGAAPRSPAFAAGFIAFGLLAMMRARPRRRVAR